MHITFGLDLDACQGPSPDDHLARPVVGRLGMLSLLETWLGLAAPEVGHARRVAVYLGALRQVDGPQRFYHRSLAADDVGTAAHLLDWRDTWAMAGWAGQAGEDAPQRLRDLADVERAAAAAGLPAGEAERLAAVATVLRDTGPGPVEAVTLVDPLEDFPHAWRQVLALLPGVTTAEPAPQGQGALLELQRHALLAVAGGRTGSALHWQDDGSVVFVRTPTATTAEHWLGALHAAQPADRLVVAETAGDRLDATLAATGSARCGFEAGSPLRPALQALGLALDLCWAPLDVGRAVDFLTHPVGPFSRSARHRLAEALAKEPGIGGPRWEATKQALAETRETEEQKQQLLRDIDFWLESERHPRSEGLPLATVRARVAALAEAFRRRLGPGDELAPVLGPAHRQCAAVLEGLDVLEGQGTARVLPRTLAQLLARATPAGTTRPDTHPQVGCLRSARLAAACVQPADEVVWWMPAAPALPGPQPWSATEVQALRNMGVTLPEPAQALAALARRWLRPLLAARHRFVLVLPPPGAEVHPTRQLLQQLVPALEHSAQSTAPHAPYTPAPAPLAGPVPHRSLPEVPATLQLPRPVALRTDRPHSYTSLNDLFNAPALYALKHLAELKPTALLAAEEDNRLLGVLAHRVFEEFFKQADALTLPDDATRGWLARTLGPLLEAEGAVLLMQGAGVSQQRFRIVCERALCALLAHLREAGATRVETEVRLEGQFAGKPLTGTADLLVHLPDGHCVALDAKWSGLSRHRKLLQEGAHLQLALYWGLIGDQPDRQPPKALGYFILDAAALLLTHPQVFPRASVHAPPEGPGTAGLLQQARASWEWRTGQLRQGLLDVVPPDPDDSHAGPPGTLPVKGPQRYDSDHTVLLGGWE